jgi:hypothetical protein
VRLKTLFRALLDAPDRGLSPEHLKIETRLRDERFESVKGAYTMCPTFDSNCEEIVERR